MSSFPSDLTFGVGDAAVFKQVIQNPYLWVQEVTIKNEGRIFFSFIDGGSNLSNDNTKQRFLLRGCVFPDQSGLQTQQIDKGDIICASDYRINETTSGENVIVVKRVRVVRRAHEPLRFHECKRYPFEGAREVLIEMKNRTMQSRQQVTNQVKQINSTERQLDYDVKQFNDTFNQTTPSFSNSKNCASRPLPSFNGSVSSVSEPPQGKFYQAMQNQQHQPSLYPTVNEPSTVNQQFPYSRNPYILSGQLNEPPRSGTASGTEGYRPIRRQQYGGSPLDAELQSHPIRAAPYPPQFRSTGPVAHRVDGQYVPIKDLNSFLGRWMVKGRFINKGEPRPYTNQRGEGKIWNIDLVDSNAERGTIRCTFFNKAIDKFYNVIKENEVYTVSRGMVKTANKKFNSGAHEFELHLGEDAEIQWHAIDDPCIPSRNNPKVLPIAQLASISKNTLVSVCGIMTKISDVSEIITRTTGQPRSKREISVVDDSGTSIDITLWGNKVLLVDGLDTGQYPIVLIENARVDEYNGRKLSSVANMTIKVNPTPDTEESRNLRQWFHNEGILMMGRFKTLGTTNWSETRNEASRLTIAEIQRRSAVVNEVELEDKGCWHTCRATITKINSDKAFFWVACPECNKKVTYPGGNDGFGTNEIEIAFCPNCQKDVEKPTKKYLLRVEIADGTGSLECQAMGDRGILVMGGISADDICTLQQKDRDPTLFKRSTDFFNDRKDRLYTFRIQAKSERYRDETTVKYKIFGIETLSGPIEESSTDKINQLHLLRNSLIKESKVAIDWIYDRIDKVIKL